MSKHKRVPTSHSLFVALATAVAGVALASSAQAATKTWNNSSGGAFNLGSNWSPSGVPGAGDDLLFNLTNTFTVTLPLTQTARSATFDAGVVTFAPGASGNVPFVLSNALVINNSATVTLTDTASGDLAFSASSVVVNGNGTFNQRNDAKLQLNSIAVGTGIGSGFADYNITGGEVISLQTTIGGNGKNGRMTLLGTPTLNPNPDIIVYYPTANLGNLAIANDTVGNSNGRLSLNNWAYANATKLDMGTVGATGQVGNISITNAFLEVGTTTVIGNYDGVGTFNLTVNASGQFLSQGILTLRKGATATVANDGLLRSNAGFVVDGGTLDIQDGGTLSLAVADNTTANFYILNGGKVTAAQTLGISGAKHRLAINGAGSSATSATAQVSNRGELVVNGGGKMTASFFSADNAAKVTVDGVGSSLIQNGTSLPSAVYSTEFTASNQATAEFYHLRVRDSSADDGSSTFLVTGGAKVNTKNSFNFSGTAQNIVIDGPGSQLGNPSAFAGNIAALVEVKNGGELTIPSGRLSIASSLADPLGTILNGTAKLTINGGLVEANEIQVEDRAKFVFNTGRVKLNSDYTFDSQVNKPFAASPTFLKDQELIINGTTTIPAYSTVTLNGGSFRTNYLNGQGTLALVKGKLTVVSGIDVGINVNPLGYDLIVPQGVTVQTFGSVTVAPTGQVTVSGLLDGAYLESSGTVSLVEPIGAANPATLSFAGVENTGTISGSGKILGSLTNTPTGQLRSNGTDHLTISGVFGNSDNSRNAGAINLDDGSVEFTTGLVNVTGGTLSGRGTLITSGSVSNFATANGPASLVNSGRMQFTTGLTDIYGNTYNAPGGRIIVSGGGSATFYSDFTHNGTEVRVSTGSDAVFFGTVKGSGTYTGGGNLYFEGTFSPGNSPSLVTINTDVFFAPLSTFEVELAGLTLGTEYDHLTVNGHLSLDGTLKVLLLDNFQPVPGNEFDILDWTTLQGTFASLDLPALSGTLTWDTSRLYTQGIIAVVPEPMTVGAILPLAPLLLRRRRQ